MVVGFPISYLPWTIILLEENSLFLGDCQFAASRRLVSIVAIFAQYRGCRSDIESCPKCWLSDPPSVD